ncbi:hypothetical protein C7B82_07915 [Stenomitos frigidus ULC18]|uniref:Uncharacterized protein n=2 Tax=Stenomitos TaxID=1844270 RepID=A0A2T1EDV4_9CYAN|nr:hypothetical protein C7B82_07915 [Stenomitos frigidus ULC18]
MGKKNEQLDGSANPQRGLHITPNDKRRTREVVEYLQQFFVDGKLGTFARWLFPKLNSESQASKRVSQLLDENHESVLTIGQLVALVTTWRKSNNPREGLPYQLSQEESLLLFQKLVRLTPEEKEQLGVPQASDETLLYQALNNMRFNNISPETIRQFYKASLAVPKGDGDLRPWLIDESLDGKLLPDIEKFLVKNPPIAKTEITARKLAAGVRSRLEHFQVLGGELEYQPKPPVCEVSEGESQNVSFEKVSAIEGSRYGQPAFIRRLTQTIVENALLTEQFPVGIKTITITDVPILPLSVTPLHGSGSFNMTVLARARDSGSRAAVLATQSPKQVTVIFYVEETDTKGEKHIHPFSVCSKGIGGVLSHIVRTINIGVLSDIKSLSSYYLVAHDVLIHYDAPQNDLPSPVWSHSLVRLCKAKVLAEALSHSDACQGLKSYQDYAFTDAIGRADACEFDMLLSPAKAALFARLRAVKHTGVLARSYLQDLNNRVRQLHQAEKAYAYLTEYPFSSLAFEKAFSALANMVVSDPLPSTAPQWMFSGYLRLADTFLSEGLYRKAYGYLKALESVFEDASNALLNWYNSYQAGQQTTLSETTVNFFGALLVRYRLFWALYYYIFDWERDRDNPFYRESLADDASRRDAIIKASQLLDEAEDLLKVRQFRYQVLGEASQGTFHPHYQLLARIYWQRVRLLMFFPQETPINLAYIPTDPSQPNVRRQPEQLYRGWLWLLEESRLYAATDGDSKLYTIVTAYQACVYLVLAFQDTPILLGKSKDTALSPSLCFSWAERLRNQALLSYAPIGEHCYTQIKQKSGVTVETQEFGLGVQSIPAIQELTPPITQHSEKRPGQRQEVLYLDMSLLMVKHGKIKLETSRPEEPIYLFGTEASYIFFIRGLYCLSSDSEDEFTASATPQSLEAWDAKFAHAFRLFTYAWALAEDGGIAMCAPNSEVRIERNFKSIPLTLDGEYKPDDAASIRDLYLVRTSEIVDLGKLFAATCLVLRQYVSATQCDVEVEALLASLQQTRSPQARTMPEYYMGQTRFNGHIASHIELCRSHLLEVQRKSTPLSPQEILKITDIRKNLLRQIFYFLFKLK